MDFQTWNAPQIVVGLAILVALLTLVQRAWRLLSIKIDQRSLTYVRQVTAALVAAAEQKANAGVLAKEGRLDWVLDELLHRFPYIGHDQADMLIHSEVYGLNLGERAAGGSAKKEQD